MQLYSSHCGRSLRIRLCFSYQMNRQCCTFQCVASDAESQFQSIGKIVGFCIHTAAGSLHTPQPFRVGQGDLMSVRNALYHHHDIEQQFLKRIILHPQMICFHHGGHFFHQWAAQRLRQDILSFTILSVADFL